MDGAVSTMQVARELRPRVRQRRQYIEAPRPELYDLERDPQETNNLYAVRQALGERLAIRLRDIGSAAGATVRPPVEVDSETRARLAALGYVGTFVTAPSRPDAVLADPKDKIDLFNLLTEARELLQDESSADAGIGALRRVVGSAPNVIDAWLVMGNEFMRRRDFGPALESYEPRCCSSPTTTWRSATSRACTESWAGSTMRPSATAG